MLPAIVTSRPSLFLVVQGSRRIVRKAIRHSCRSWLDATGAAPSVTKDLIRHSAIATTFNVYGKAVSPEKREANNRVVELLFAADTVDTR
jgi:integrase